MRRIADRVGRNEEPSIGLGKAALTVLVLVFAFGEAARAVTIVDRALAELTVGPATLRVDRAMPDTGLAGPSLSASFSGTLSFSGGQNLPPPRMGE